MRTPEAGVRVIPYFSSISRTTCYVVIPRGGTRAILVDPVPFDNALYAILLRWDLKISWVLVTHPEAYMLHPLRTLGRIFHFEIVAGETTIGGMPCRSPGTETVNEMVLEGVRIQAIPFLPHSRSSFVYRIDDSLFSGSILHAGTLGDTASPYNEELLVAAVKDHLFTIPHADRDILLLPAVGPPSTLRAERHLSPYYRERDPSL